MARGEQAEQRAREHLQEAGLRLQERNYRCRHGEIDLIMRDGDTLVFVEVRERRNSRFGSGADSVDARKRHKLIATAQHYLQRSRAASPCRFDVVSIDGSGQLLWIAGAFDAE